MTDITIAATARRVQYVASSPNQAEFSIPFQFYDNADVKVYLGTSAVAETSGFTITGALAPSGRKATFSPPLAGGTRVTLNAETVVERTSNYTDSGEWTASNVNTDLNRLHIYIQELRERLSRSVLLPTTTLLAGVVFPDGGSVANANRLIQWNADGDELIYGPTAAEVENAEANAAAAIAAASAASTSATAASTSATAASTSATAAAGSATTASSAASASAASASNAATAQSVASSSASAAGTSATNAASSATSAGNSATSASGSASTATTQAATATTQAGIATTKASEASASAAAAAASAASIDTSNFVDIPSTQSISGTKTFTGQLRANGGIAMNVPSASPQIQFNRTNAYSNGAEVMTLGCINSPGGWGVYIAAYEDNISLGSTRLVFYTNVAGAFTNELALYNGLYSIGLSGLGVGSINMAKYGRNGVEGNLLKKFVSSDLTITNGSSGSVSTHGLGGVPDFILFDIVCQTAEGGYSVGEVITFQRQGDTNAAAGSYGFNASFDATNIPYTMGASGMLLLNKTSGVVYAANSANWKLRIKAYKLI